MKQLAALLFLSITFISFGQRTPEHLIIRGTVMGYQYDPSAGIFKKDQVDIQGTLEGVTFEAFVGSKSITKTKSSSGGDFGLSLEIGKKYALKYSKSGYGNSRIDIDLSEIPENFAKGGLLLKNIELLLNHFKSDKAIDNGKTLGEIKFNSSKKQFVYNPQIYDKKERLFKKEEDNAAKTLLAESIDKNKSNNATPFKTGVTVTADNVNDNNGVTENPDINENKKNTAVIPRLGLTKDSPLAKIDNWNAITKDDLDVRAQEIQDAWAQLEKDKLIAVTPEDFLVIQAREELLKAAEKELDAAKLYIVEQDEKLSAQKSFNILLILGLLILAAFAFILFKRNKEKKTANALLAAKNKKITDSINYAERIQRSILLSDAKIKGIFPSSFIYHKPLAIVSGDFYWFSEIKGKKIVAAIDCTGHGVPGAFMSLIANTLLNQIVNEKGITSTSQILTELNLGIQEALHQESNDGLSQDGMDMSICAYDQNLKQLTFSGAMNFGYLVQNNELTELEADIIGIGGMMRPERLEKFKFQEQTLSLSTGDMVYLFSDGYMDQFGGSENKKFNLTQFKELLKKVSSMSVEDQKSEIDKAFVKWKGATPQIDDVLVIGVKA